MTIDNLYQASILVVDDNQTNLQLLSDLLTNFGFKVLIARSGKSALQKVAYSPPDLILLDVLMPEMDGFETCQSLKTNELIAHIPVIFMTALADTENKIKGFSVGAVDYITNPFQQEEVLTRVKTHLSIHRLTLQLKFQNDRLQQEATEREKLAGELERRVEERTVELTQANKRLQQEITDRTIAEKTLQQSLSQLQKTQAQLIQSEKMSALGQMVAGVAHEINNPINFIYGNISHVRYYVSDLLMVLNTYQQMYPHPTKQILEQVEAVDLDFLVEDLPKMLSSMEVGSERIREIVLSLRRFSHHDGTEMKPTNLHESLDSTLMILDNRLKSRSDRASIEIIKKYSSNLPLVHCYAGEINQVLMNILANAIDAIDEYNDKRSLDQLKLNPSSITIETQVLDSQRVAIKIADKALGISPELSSRIFDPFFTTKPPGKGTGIGLSISWQIVVEKHKGSLRCISSPGKGTEFVIELPVEPDATLPVNLSNAQLTHSS